MIKRMVKSALRSVRHWLEDESSKIGAAKNEEEPLTPLDSLCASILEKDSRRPNYVWGVVNAAGLAQALEIPRISVIELGVAGGNGLIALEKITTRVAEALCLQIDVYGFDSGVGLPKPTDYRDLPNLFSEGFFPMDANNLRARLDKAQLMLGSVENTIPKFVNSNPSPIGFIAFDLDLYSSTKHALRLFDADEKFLLPRVYCYFDDMLGYTYSEFTGELLAISEFNTSHAMRKISKINGLRYLVPRKCQPHCWVEQFYMAHIFDHKLYGEYDGSNPQTTLDLAPDAAIA